MRSVLSLDAVTRTYRAGVPGCLARVEVLRGVDLQVTQGEILGVAGLRGAGKTTLLLCAAGLLRPDSGAITWFGSDRLSAATRSNVAFVPACPVYYSFLTVRDALQAHRSARTPFDAGRLPNATELADTLELSELWSERIASLASPLVQRVAIAAALLNGARLLLLDEADSALTPNAQQRGQALVCALRRWGVTTVAATRNAEALTTVVSRVVTLADGRVSGPRRRALDGTSLDPGERGPAKVAEGS
jgi:ABC-2 type transport system ATP-binding protein